MKCLFCGGELCWDSDANASEMYSEYEEGDAANVCFMHCMTCGRSYEIADPCEEERETSYAEYWNKGNKVEHGD